MSLVFHDHWCRLLLLFLLFFQSCENSIVCWKPQEKFDDIFKGVWARLKVHFPSFQLTRSCTSQKFAALRAKILQTVVWNFIKTARFFSWLKLEAFLNSVCCFFSNISYPFSYNEHWNNTVNQTSHQRTVQEISKKPTSFFNHCRHTIVTFICFFSCF